MERVDDAEADPERAAVCGLLPAESVNTRVAVRTPEAEGVKVMVTEQLEDAIKVAPHVLLVIAKSEELAPVIAIPVMLRTDVPPLLSVTDLGELVDPIATLAKVTLPGDTDTLPAPESVPIPERETRSDVPFAVRPRVAVREPDDVGLNTTLMVQLAAAARLAPHELLAIWKSPAFAPESPAAPSDAAVKLLLLNVTVWAALELPSTVSGNEIEVGFTATVPVAATLPVPESVTWWGLPLAESEIVNIAVRDPEAVGLKRRPMLQLPEPERLEPQLLLAIEKSPEFVPEIVTLAMEIVVVPSLCRVTDWTALAEPTLAMPKESVCGVMARVLIFPVAVPESDTVCDELNPEWLMVSVASRAPGSWGVKVTVTIQLEWAARVAPQVWLVMEKSAALVPEMPMLFIVTGDPPTLLRVTGVGVPVEPRATLPQTTLRGSMRTPTTRQPVNVSERRRTEKTNRLPAWFRRRLAGCKALRVIVTSSGFILLGVERTSPRRKQWNNEGEEGPARLV
jgi:hypothetical protein